MLVHRITRQPSPADLSAHRIQSLVLASTEDLRLRAFQAGHKEVQKYPLKRAFDVFLDWAGLDNLGDANVAAAIPLPTKNLYLGETDTDFRAKEWTPERERLAQVLSMAAQRGMEAIIGYPFKNVWGRASQGGTGHALVRIDGTKGEIKNLRRRLTVNPIPYGEGCTFRIELRLAPESPSSPAFFTLPGSTYPSRLDPEGLDLIAFQHVDRSLKVGDKFPDRIGSIPAEVMGHAVYAGHLVAIAIGGWEEGAHHDASMRLAGIMARDIADGLYDQRQAEILLMIICEVAGDTKLDKRLDTLRAAIATHTSGRPVYGFQAFADQFGEPAMELLIKLRGQGDPNAREKLHARMIFSTNAEGTPDAYIDIEAPRGVNPVMAKVVALTWFSNQPAFRPVLVGKKQVPLVELLMSSGRMQTARTARRFPGVPRGTWMVQDSLTSARPATEEERYARDDLVLNIGDGYATPLVEAEDIEPQDSHDFARLWWRHLDPVVNYKKDLAAKVTEIIAFKIQNPLVKPALGVCLTGGGGIGKSSIFNQILPSIIGHNLVSSISVHQINQGSAFAYEMIPGTLFCLAEEAGMSRLKAATIEILKDLMKNPTLMINRKGVQQYTSANYAVPFFVTNDDHPSLNIGGMGERSLRVIKGVRAADMRVTEQSPEWLAFQAQCSRYLGEFMFALETRPRLREAALRFFMDYDLGPEARKQAETAPEDTTDVVDPRDRLDPVQEALVRMLERNSLSKKTPELYPLTEPFRFEWLEDALLDAMRTHGEGRRGLTKNAIGRTITNLFRDPSDHDAVVLKSAQKNVPSFRTRVKSDTEMMPRLKYRFFAWKYGTLIAHLKANTGVEIEPAWELSDADYGKTPWPTDAELEAKVNHQNPFDNQ